MTGIDDASRLAELVAAVADRCSREPNLDDFLLWNAGTLEYWLHVLISSVGQTVGWAPRTEVPYITGCPAPTSKSNLKWADGAVVWPDGLAAIIDVKTVPMRASLGKVIEQVPKDMAALLATDWTATRSQARDAYTDAGWWRELDRIERPWGLALALVHGERKPMKDCSPPVRAGVKRGLDGLEKQFGQPGPPWLYRTKACFETPLLSIPIDTENAAAVLLAWAGPILERS